MPAGQLRALCVPAGRSPRDPAFAATAPFSPREGPCASDECFPSCVSTPRQPGVSLPGRLKEPGRIRPPLSLPNTGYHF